MRKVKMGRLDPAASASMLAVAEILPADGAGPPANFSPTLSIFAPALADMAPAPADVASLSDDMGAMSPDVGRAQAAG
jgi:hypothetical protein